MTASIIVSLQSEVLTEVEVMFPPLGFSVVMQVNNQLQNVSNTHQEVAGVMLYKDETGVTAKFDLNSTLKAHLLFDGSTAQFQLTGSDVAIFAFAVIWTNHTSTMFLS